MKQPKISIIVPIYKAEDTIRRLLDSFMCQPCKDIEFFLIDNASPDRCGEICQEYVEKDSRFVLHTLKENIGYIRARMYGINNCNGEFVGFADSDDYIPENCYEELIELINIKNPDFITCSFCGVFGETKRHTPVAIPEGLYSLKQINEKIMPSLFGNDDNTRFLQGFMWKNLYKKQIIIDNAIDFIYELVPYEDQIFNIDFVKCCNKVAVVDKEVYFYVSSTDSITGANRKKFVLMDEYNRILKLFNAKIERSYGEYKKFIANDLTANLYSTFLFAAKTSSKEEIKEFCNSFDDSLRQFVREYSDTNSRRYKITRICVSHKKYDFLISIIRLALKIRG